MEELQHEEPPADRATDNSVKKESLEEKDSSVGNLHKDNVTTLSDRIMSYGGSQELLDHQATHSVQQMEEESSISEQQNVTSKSTAVEKASKNEI